mmetsp:Transcript_16525/g.39308  ORF Transcript_16525/g.39308 Transcript_16525/m.39308 type:complete len:692 (+) Transcript_16525:184-2259(+)
MAFTSRKRAGAVANKKNKDNDDSSGKPSRNVSRSGRSLSRKGSNEYDSDNDDDNHNGSNDSNGNDNVHQSVDPNAPLSRRTPMDLTLLARGMSARAVGSRVSDKIPILSSEDEIDKDLRHMEAYDVACTTYSQQFFAYTNQELVSRGVYGPVPPLPGQPGYPGTAGYPGYPGAGGQYGQGGSPQQRYQRLPDGRMVPVGSPSSAGPPPPGGAPFAMPAKIDPEEEKRLAQLKKKIALAETRREHLEGEFESLKSHFWWASKVLERTRHSATGQSELLRDVVQRRGRVVALRRVQYAVSKDILACLEARGRGVAIGGKSAIEASDTNGDTAMEGVEKEKENENEENKKTIPEMKDLVDCWNWIDSQLHEAEKACTEASSPAELIDLKKILAEQRKGRPADSASDTDGSKSPVEGKSSQKDKKKDKRGGSGDEGSGAGGSSAKDIDAAVFAGEDGILPWMSQIMPRTPHGVPVYYSYLSTAPDRAGAFGTGGAFGADPNSLAWLEANLPKTFEPDYAKDREELDRVREEVEYLAEELEFERDNNKELQTEIIGNRKRSDEMISMMSIIRTETEAVLNRHNMILDTKEARTKAEVLHKEHLLTVEREELVRKEEAAALPESAVGDAADGDAASLSVGVGGEESKNAVTNDANGAEFAVNDDDSTSNKRSLETTDSDSPSRSNGGFGATKRRRRM